MPTVVVATDAFAELAREAAEAAGLEGLRLCEVAHPVGGISESALAARAQAALEALMARLTGS